MRLEAVPKPAVGEVPAGGGGDPLLRCLLRLSRALGRPLGEAEARALGPASKGALSIDGFRLAAQRLGWRTGPADLDAGSLPAMPLPLLLTGAEGGPRVVLRRRRGVFEVWSPAEGQARELTAAALLALGGQAMLVARAPAVEPATGSWRGLLGGRVRGVLWELALASLVINIFALAGPLFTMTVYNKIIGQQAMDTLTVLTIGIAIVYGFELLLRLVRGYVAGHTAGRVEALIGGEAMHRLLRLPYRRFESAPSGTLGERLRQLDVIRAFFTGQMPLVLADLLFVGIFLAALFLIEPRMAWITLASLPVFLGVSALFHRRQRDLAEQGFHSQSEKSTALNEMIGAALTVKALGLEAEMERRWDERLARSAWLAFRTGVLANALGTIGNLLQQAVLLLILVTGAGLIVAGEMSLGGLIATGILAARTIAPMRQAVAAWHHLHETRDAFGRLDEILREAPEAEAGDRAPGPPLQGAVTFESVTFRYRDDGQPALRDVDFAVTPGQMLGIVGPSGSGKSTLAKLLLGLYAPQAGRVLIDATDIAHMAPAELRRQVAMVPQEVQLFAGSIRDNILIGLPDPDPAQAVAAARFVGAHDFIERLPRGYETALGEGGSGLSAGQRQLVAIARALVRNPRLLVLDEATSALDPGTEERLLAALRRGAAGRTIVLVTHRLGSLAGADRVALLLQGRLDCFGAPAEVLAHARARMGRRPPETAP